MSQPCVSPVSLRTAVIIFGRTKSGVGAIVCLASELLCVRDAIAYSCAGMVAYELRGGGT